MPEMVRRYTGKTISTIYRIFVWLLLLVGVVFIYTPGDIVATQICGFSGLADDWRSWIIYGVIFIYYLVAAVCPIDKIIGRIYPVMGGILLFSTLGVFVGLLAKGYPLLNLWNDWNSVSPVRYGDYFTANHFIPVFFVTVACGILSGFHSTQTAIISRTVMSEKQGRHIFYSMMVLEGFIAMVWAAAAMGVYSLGMQEPNPSLATGTIGVICKDLLGNVGGIVALLGVIVLPVTTGDTALRSLRLSVTEAFHINQSTGKKRLNVSAVIFIFVAGILVWAKTNADGFASLWRYFSWFNQFLSLFAFAAICIWMFENGKAKFVWIPLIPGGFYAFITMSYILNATIGFNLPWPAAYVIALILMAAYIMAILINGNKRKNAQFEKI